MFANQILQSIDGFRFGNIEFHRRLADVEIHLARRAADVAEIGVRHFARAVHDAAHDRDLHALEMQRGGFDRGGGGLQIEERPAAGRASDVVGLENPVPAPAEYCRRGAAPVPALPRPARESHRQSRRKAASRCSSPQSATCAGNPHSRFPAFRKHVFEQDRMPRLELCREQTKRRDHGQIDIISHGDQLRRSLRVQLRDGRIVARIDFRNAGLLVNDLGLVVAHLVDLVRDLVEVRLPNNDAHHFLAAEPHCPGNQCESVARR